MKLSKNQQAFFALLRAGLWEQNVQLSQFKGIDFNEIYRLAEEQSVVGLIAAGAQHVVDVKVPQIEFLTFIGRAVQIEQQNSNMNQFIERLVPKMRKEGIYTLLVKGQGIAQCYERPLWRSCGDVDLLLNAEDYERAKHLLSPRALSIAQEISSVKHQGLTMDGGFMVELHGTLHTRLSNRIDKLIDNVQADTFTNKRVRVWRNGNADVLIPAPDNDIIFLFTHIIKHFYVEGIGLRQICDWCRFFWIYHNSLDMELLEQRLRSMKLMSEWQAFAALAVDWLGIPVEAMPFYSNSNRCLHKATMIMDFMFETGNFGHNRNQLMQKSYIINKTHSLNRKIIDFGRHARIFPLDSTRFFFHIMKEGLGNIMRGEA